MMYIPQKRGLWWLICQFECIWGNIHSWQYILSSVSVRLFPEETEWVDYVRENILCVPGYHLINWEPYRAKSRRKINPPSVLELEPLSLPRQGNRIPCSLALGFRTCISCLLGWGLQHGIERLVTLLVLRPWLWMCYWHPWVCSLQKTFTVSTHAWANYPNVTSPTNSPICLISER